MELGDINGTSILMTECNATRFAFAYSFDKCENGSEYEKFDVLAELNTHATFVQRKSRF